MQWHPTQRLFLGAGDEDDAAVAAVGPLVGTGGPLAAMGAAPSMPDPGANANRTSAGETPSTTGRSDVA